MKNETKSVTRKSSVFDWGYHWFVLPFLIMVVVLTVAMGNAWSGSITPWFAYPLAVIPAVIFALAFTWICGDFPTTLVEMGVGATISCILVVICVPTFAMAREKVRAKTCMSNERKLGMAIWQYAADYDGMMPPVQTWADTTLPYISATERKGILSCPAAPKQKYGYAVNGRMSGEQLEITYNADIPLLYDSTAFKPNAVDTVPFASLPTTQRHSWGNAVLWVDGHVSCLKSTDRKQEKPLLATR